MRVSSLFVFFCFLLIAQQVVAQGVVSDIRPEKLDPGTVSIATGDVVLPTDLMHVPGRNGLDISVPAIYNSSTKRAVETWNKDAPTGVIGLGWTLVQEKIIRDTNMTTYPGDDQYFLVDQTGTNELVLVDDSSSSWTFEPIKYHPWVISYEPSIEKWTITKENGNKNIYGGRAAPTSGEDVDSEYVQVGLVHDNWIGSSKAKLNNSQYVAVAWNLQQIQTISGDGVNYHYQNTQQYVLGNTSKTDSQYTQASYLSSIDHLRITGNQATQSSASKPTVTDVQVNNGPYSSFVNVAVTASSLPCGSYELSDSATKYTDGKVEGWIVTIQPSTEKVSSSSCDSGETVTVDLSQDVFIPGISPGGAPYNLQVIYESETGSALTTTFSLEHSGAYADLVYKDKESFEYQDPHTEHSEPDAYQERYQTKYLNSVSAYSVGGDLLYTTNLGYENSSGETAFLGSGSMSKRLLKSVAYVNSDGNPFSPSKEFSYWGEEDSDGVSVTLDSNSNIFNSENGALFGALKSMTSPLGGTISYMYSQNTIASSDASLKAQAPKGYTGRKVVFGPDYAVIFWGKGNKLKADIYQWVGEWVLQSNDITVSDSKQISVMYQEDFFSVLTKGKGDNQDVTFFHKNPLQPGVWLKSSHSTYLNNGKASMVGGSNFVIAWSPEKGKSNLYRYVWNDKTQSWVGDTSPVNKDAINSVSAKNNFYVVAEMKTYSSTNGDGVDRDVTVRLTSLDNSLLSWKKSGGDYKYSIMSSGHVLSNPELTVNTTPTHAVISTAVEACAGTKEKGCTSPNPESAPIYNVKVVSWDQNLQNFKGEDLPGFPNSQWYVNNDFATHVVDDLIVIYVDTSHLFNIKKYELYAYRFDGSKWHGVSKTSVDRNNVVQHDLFSKDSTEKDKRTNYLYQYDPNSLKWTKILSYDEDYPLYWTHVWEYIDLGANLLLLALDFTGVGEVASFILNANLIALEYAMDSVLNDSIGGGGALTSQYFSGDNKVYYRKSDGKWSHIGDIVTTKGVKEISDGQEVAVTNKYITSIGWLEKCTTKELDCHYLFVEYLKNGVFYNDESKIITPVPKNIAASYGPQTITGPDAFAAYEYVKDINDATYFNLYRVINNQVEGKMQDFVVSRVEVNDGNQNIFTHYIYDSSSAMFDKAGENTLYNKVTVVPSGSSATANYSNGFVENYFYNNYNFGESLPPYSSASTMQLCSNPTDISTCTNQTSNNLSLFSGMQYYKQVCPASDNKNPTCNAPVATTSKSYSAYSVDLSKTGKVSYYVRQSQVNSQIDGVQSQANSTYTQNGLLESVTTSNYSLSGYEETYVKTLAYGSEKYSGMKDANILNAVVQSKTTVQNSSQDAPTVVDFSTTTWKDFTGDGLWLPYQQWIANQNDPKTINWKTNQPNAPNRWISVLQVTEVNDEFGTTTEFLDSNNVTHSFLYGQNYEQLVTSSVNASIVNNETGYIGFEDYEQMVGWSFDNQSPTNALSHTGTNSLSLDSLSLQYNSFSPRSDNPPYVVSGWFNPASGQTCSIGFGTEVVETDSDITGWQYLEYTTTNVSKSNPPSILCSKGGAVDDVRFGPVDSPFVASVYDDNYLVTAVLGANGETHRNFYDQFNRLTMATAANDEPFMLAGRFFSRDQQGNGAYVPALPNSSFSITARNGGERFYLTNSGESAWAGGIISDGTLQLNNKNDSSVLTSVNGKTLTSDYGIRTEVSAKLGSSSKDYISVGVSIGDVNVSYKQTSVTGEGSYILSNNNKSAQSVETASLAQDWLVMAEGSTVYFFADGQLIFPQPSSKSSNFGSKVTGGLTLTATNTTATFSDISVFLSPIVSTSYANGVGQSMQDQALESDASVIISGALYDSLGRLAYQTVPSRKGDGATYFKTLGYEGGFATGVDSSGKMLGSINGWLDKQFATDYPYYENVFSTTPLSRKTQSTFPNKDFIAGADHSVDYEYGQANAPSSLSQLYSTVGISSANEPNYYVDTVSVPYNNSDRVSTISLADMRGRLVAEQTDGGGSLTPTNSWNYEYQTNGNQQVTKSPPNVYAQSTPNPAFNETATSDFIGNIAAQVTPDTGTSEYIYDQSSRLRFKLDANGTSDSGKDQVLYWKYDVLGRVIEEGYFSANWDDLPDKASTPNYPSSGNTWVRQYVYDINGSDSQNLKGRLYQVLTSNTGGNEADVTETYTYDLQGNILTTSTLVSGYDTYITTYTYDQLGNIETVAYPSSGEASTVVKYSYNTLGQIDNIGTAQNKHLYATYKYNANGGIDTETLNNSNTPVVRSYGYNSLEWVTSISDSFFSEELSYQDADGNYLNGNITETTFDFTADGLGQSYSYEYSYDELGQLTDATSQGVASKNIKSNGEWDVSIGGYDLNGNIMSLTRGSGQSADTTTYIYNTNTNQIQSTAESNGGGESFFYDANGNTIEASTPTVTSLEYKPFMDMTSVVNTSENNVSFLYGVNNRRVLKSATQSSSDSTVKSDTLYLHSTTPHPLTEVANSSSGATSVNNYIYGPTGLVAINNGNNNYFISKDHLGSTRLVFDQSNTVQAYFNYLPFGELMNDNSSPASSSEEFSYRFTGQEYDEETGLYNFHARMYDAGLGRFYAPDPMGQFATPYEYASNDPIDNIDPTGMLSLGSFARSSERAGIRVAENVSMRESQRMAVTGTEEMITSEAQDARYVEGMAGDSCQMSFTDGTDVVTDGGLVNISEVVVGDTVWSFNEDVNEIEKHKVVELKSRKVDQLVHIIIGDEYIEATAEHPFFVEGQGWTKAESLEVGDGLVARDGSSVVVNSIEFKSGDFRVFNFVVETAHTYYISALEVLVHNPNPACDGLTKEDIPKLASYKAASKKLRSKAAKKKRLKGNVSYKYAEPGRATRKNYRKNYFEHYTGAKKYKTTKDVEDIGNVHHALEQGAVMKRFPGVFDPYELHSVENLRGVPQKINSVVHLSWIRRWWDDFYRPFIEAGTNPTREEWIAYAVQIDGTVGNMFYPPLY